MIQLLIQADTAGTWTTGRAQFVADVATIGGVTVNLLAEDESTKQLFISVGSGDLSSMLGVLSAAGWDVHGSGGGRTFAQEFAANPWGFIQGAAWQRGQP